MPFTDTPEGSTHHDDDSCVKCEGCKAHFWKGVVFPHACAPKEKLEQWYKEFEDRSDTK